MSIKVVCSGCGHIYANPQLDQREVDRLYRDLYRSIPGDDAARPDEDYLYWKRRKAEEDYSWLRAQLPPGVAVGSVLEIGCAEGLLLRKFADDGWQAVGVEPTPSYATYARDVLGLEVLDGLFEGVSLEGRRFDLVVAMFVLEHAKKPLEFLERIRGVVNPGGRIFLTVPSVFNLSDFPDDWLSSPHLMILTPDTLRRLLSRTGYRATRIGPLGDGLAAIAELGPALYSSAPPAYSLSVLRLAVIRARAAATIKIGLANARHRTRCRLAAIIGERYTDRLVALLRR